MSAAQTSTNNGSNDAPVVSGPIHHIHLGYIGRWDEERGDYEPTDEALIFLNDDNEQTCHVEGPNAKAMAAFIVRAVNSHEALVKALEIGVSDLEFILNELIAVRPGSYRASNTLTEMRAALARHQDRPRKRG